MSDRTRFHLTITLGFLFALLLIPVSKAVVFSMWCLRFFPLGAILWPVFLCFGLLIGMRVFRSATRGDFRLVIVGMVVCNLIGGVVWDYFNDSVIVGYEKQSKPVDGFPGVPEYKSAHEVYGFWEFSEKWVHSLSFVASERNAHATSSESSPGSSGSLLVAFACVGLVGGCWIPFWMTDSLASRFGHSRHRRRKHRVHA